MLLNRKQCFVHGIRWNFVNDSAKRDTIFIYTQHQPVETEKDTLTVKYVFIRTFNIVIQLKNVREKSGYRNRAKKIYKRCEPHR